MVSSGPVHLRADGVSVVICLGSSGLPEIVHWGRELAGETLSALIATSRPAVLPSSTDQPRGVSIVPMPSQAWSGTPGAAFHRGGRAPGHLALAEVDTNLDDSRSTVASFTLRDSADGVRVTYEFRLTSHGILSARAELTNDASTMDVVDLAALRVLLPVPARAREVLDFTGHWTGERQAQRSPLSDGTRLRGTHRGRQGHDSPFLSVVGTNGFGFGHGEVWGVHVAWSGNVEQLVERLPEGAGVQSTLIGGGELLAPGEIRLAPGETYRSPMVYCGWSDEGLDGMSRRLHALARDLPGHPSTPRPLVLNTWEAVYFDQNLARLTDLADRAAAIGVERFVLDDGWFTGRHNDKAGLGDWQVDPTVWPQGLGVLADHVHALGMQFGLWFEPEMANLDSELARSHPEWLFRPDGPSWRHQYGLNITDGNAWEYLYKCIDEVVTRYGVDFIKWDHNRDLADAVDPTTGSPVTHQQTVALYALLDALRTAHPELEIESCASGGGRADLGMMAHAQRIWASDTIDPVERQRIQRWTGVLLPPELVGSHVGGATAHTTGRTTSLPFRLATALFGHAGIEWDISTCGEEELALLRSWAALYKEVRGLLHHGHTVRAGDLDDDVLLHGVVSPDRTRALFSWVRLQSTTAAYTPRVRFPGLSTTADYLVRVRDEIGPAGRPSRADPTWLPEPGGSVTLPGELLATVGVPLPLLNPAQAMLFDLTAR